MHSMKGIVILKREGLESRIPATEDRWDARCRSFLLAILYIAFFSSPRHPSLTRRTYIRLRHLLT
jgi:hypothetical protein